MRVMIAQRGIGPQGGRLMGFIKVSFFTFPWLTEMSRLIEKAACFEFLGDRHCGAIPCALAYSLVPMGRVRASGRLNTT